MILYTPMPLETVYQGLEEYKPDYLEIELEGTRVLVERMGLNEGKIVRLFSTDPQDYLDPGLQPGNQVSFLPGR